MWDSHTQRTGARSQNLQGFRERLKAKLQQSRYATTAPLLPVLKQDQVMKAYARLVLVRLRLVSLHFVRLC